MTLLAAAAVLLAVVVYSPLFVLQRISVGGMQTLTEADIWSIAGIHKGEPLFRLQTDEIKHRLESDLRIEEAIRRLDRPDNRRALRLIGQDLGFNSPTTFHTQFQQRTGLTPSQYRRKVQQLTGSSEEEMGG